MTPDPLTIATRYGLPWGVATGLFAIVLWMYTTTVPKWLYLKEVDEKTALISKVGELVGDVRELLSLVKDRRGSL